MGRPAVLLSDQATRPSGLGLIVSVILQSDLDLFLDAFGNRGVLDLTKTDLTRWNIHQTDPVAFTNGPVTDFHHEVALYPHDPVFVRQRNLWVSRVEEYAAMMTLGDTIAAVQVTDVEPGGGFWHINGLHRIVAARLLHMPVVAEIWR